MASVDVKLTLSPAEFDLMRESVAEQYGYYLARGDHRAQNELTASERREANARAVKLKDLHDRLHA